MNVAFLEHRERSKPRRLAGLQLYIVAQHGGGEVEGCEGEGRLGRQEEGAPQPKHSKTTLLPGLTTKQYMRHTPCSLDLAAHASVPK